MEYDKLANEKTEMQRHYVMVRKHHNRERLWFLIAKLGGALLWQPILITCVVVIVVECQVRACESPQGVVDVACCY